MSEYSFFDKFLVYVSAIFQIITTITIIILSIKVKNLQRKELFSSDGNILYGDIPEKIVAGNTEYDNPLYDSISRHWEPTEHKFDGYTTWRRKD